VPPTMANMNGGPPLAPPPMGGAPLAPPPTTSAPAAPTSAFPGNTNATMYPAADPSVATGGYQPPAQLARGPDAHSAAVQEEITQFNSPAHFVQSTVGRLPNSISSKQKANVPLGIIIQPLAPIPAGTEDVPTVNFATVGTIIRCKACRTYMNPYVTWEANGRRWVCNSCGHSQQTQDSYFSSLDETGKRMDRFQRPELCKGAVDYIAPGEYMVRPPQPPVFMFVIDVSYTAVVTGMLDCVVSTIKDAIQEKKLPGGQRAQMGIITFDTALHFYNLNSNLPQPQMLVVSDLEDLFLPLPDDILVPISESESTIITLLDSLPTMFGDTIVSASCLGSAVKGAFMAMKHIGGKMLVFGACIPSIGDLSLKSTRDNPRLLGTEKEVELLRPVTNKEGSDGYKDLGTELTRAQISLELFMAPQQYVDLASISPIAKLTGGDLRFYPQFHINTLGPKLRSELTHVLSRYMGWEAVMRVRVSRGWKITNFFGHLFIRGQDLILVPNCHIDQTFAISIDMDENVNPDPVFCMQSALLYTNSDGERRIRVHTWASLLTQNYADIIGSINVQATIAMLSQIALKHTLKHNLPEGRNMLQNQCQQFVQAGNVCPNVEALQFLPLYVMGMLKSPAFRGPNDITADMRTYIWSRLENLMVSQLSTFYYPRMIALHNIPGHCGIPDEDGIVTLPDMLNLTSESMTQDGVFLLEDGEALNVWIGSAVDPGFLQAVFGVSSFDQLEPFAAESVIGTRGDPVSNQVGHIIAQVRRERAVPYLLVNVVRQGDQPKEMKFFASLIEDRTIGLQSTYSEFLSRMGYRPQQQQAAPPASNPMASPPPMGGMTPGAMGSPAMTTPPSMMGAMHR